MSPDLSPADGVVALRSLPRRFRVQFAAVSDDDDPADLAHRAGPDGRSALDHLRTATSGLALMDRSLAQVLTLDDPVLHPGVLDLGHREPIERLVAPDHLDEALDTFEAVATEMADRVEHTHGADWTREGRIADHDQTVSALALLRRAVDDAVADLKAIRATLDAVRRAH